MHVLRDVLPCVCVGAGKDDGMLEVTLFPAAGGASHAVETYKAKKTWEVCERLSTVPGLLVVQVLSPVVVCGLRWSGVICRGVWPSPLERLVRSHGTVELAHDDLSTQVCAGHCEYSINPL